MTTYDFDCIIDRANTGCLKYDFAVKRGKAPDLLPLWVADMDFSLPAEVLGALKARIDHGIFGYTQPLDPYYDAVLNWVEKHQHWRPERKWLVTTPGVVFALACAVRAFTEPGDAVLIQQPVYYPFKNVIVDNGRTLVNAPLVYKDGAYSIDFAAFEKAVEDAHVKLFILCNPHNPASRVWTRGELEQLARICKAHGVTVVSDEIHADFVWGEREFTSFGSLGSDIAGDFVVCTAPSKSFNIAGLQISNIFIPNTELRHRFRAARGATGYDEPSVMGLAATEACYTVGAEWFDQVCSYIWGNICFMRDYLAEHAPQLHMVDCQGTYLVWVDCRALGLDAAGIRELVEDKARLWLDLGDMFGEDGTGFIRFNVACPRCTLERALKQLCAAVAEL